MNYPEKWHYHSVTVVIDVTLESGSGGRIHLFSTYNLVEIS